MKMSAAAAAVAALAMLAASSKAGAEPAVKVTTTYYAIGGTMSAELKAQMRSLGPHGFWAYTRWYVRWTGACRVSLEISYTYPRWTDEGSAPPQLRAEWNRMMERLRAHEQGHGQHGRNAAREVEQSGCRDDPRRITGKWAEQDKVYDTQTSHGRAQGVVLP
jgi:predicted secreted Zn-dependent protease